MTMTSFPKLRLIAITASMAFLAACGGAPDGDGADGEAAADQPAVIGERQENFEAIGDAFKLIRSELEIDNPDFAAIGNAATDINGRAQKITGYFPEGTSVDDGYDTEALATIWEDPTGFETAAQNLVDASAEMMTVAASGDAAAVAAQAKEVGGTCKGCHDKFRLDDD
ncbi:cytochrome c [Erythrobacter insulae]|uniref:Cytochrome c n=1 Tax=Erythrobacter insulae TaxID=2584124 RepID=A0A547PDX8_9SPHN|nr:cytochrome c [Erythrobacter insulae]TRD12254.1 cytochrome c [Erythrobacter insulae]